MIEEGISKIISLSGPKTFKVDDLEYFGNDRMFELITPPTISALTVTTLTALCEYVNKCSAGETVKIGFVHVEGVTSVEAVVNADPKFRHRQRPIQAKAIIDQFNYGQWISLQTFIPSVQSMFTDEGDRAELLKYTGNVTAESSVNVADDGITQRTQVRKGIAKLQEVSLPQTVTLHPFETFPEIDQPARKFVFRIQKTETDFLCKLLPADGETWKIPVKEQIALFILNRVGTVPVIY
jgi:hypothetical protein